jgi:hypothetical protein
MIYLQGGALFYTTFHDPREGIRPCFGKLSLHYL